MCFFCNDTATTGIYTLSLHDALPSDVSTRIKELEAGLEVPLVNRDKQRLTLTPEGRAFYPQAQQLLEQSRQCRTFFRHAMLPGPLRLGLMDVALVARSQAPVLRCIPQTPPLAVNTRWESAFPLM